MEIKRDRYLKKLTDRKENGLVKVITGIRRCGKSYLLAMAARRWRESARRSLIILCKRGYLKQYS